MRIINLSSLDLERGGMLSILPGVDKLPGQRLCLFLARNHGGGIDLGRIISLAAWNSGNFNLRY